MSWMMIFNKDNRYIVLAIISLSVLLWHNWGMNIERVFPLNQSKVSMLNDTINGGQSLGRIYRETNTITFTCKTKRSNTFPFCSVMIPITDNENQGIDFRGLSNLKVSLSYSEVSDLRDSILIYLLNDETDSASGEHISRANLKTITPTSTTRSTYNIDLDALHVPSWWLLSHPNVSETTAKLDNVTHIQIATGDSHRLKNTRIDIHQLKVQGKWITLESLQVTLFIIWTTTVLADIVSRLIRSKRSAQNSISIAHKERDKYQRLAVKDPLTGINNRQAVLEYYPSIRHSTQSKFIILFDIDHFKKVNDIYGHNEGDKILVSLSNLVTEHLGPGACFARWGGEEFIILCEEHSHHAAYILAERIRLIIANAKLSQYTTVTCSVGVSLVDPSLPLKLNIEQADKALYQAKNSGRNQVCCCININDSMDKTLVDTTT